MKLVLDEWLWSDLGGENQSERQRQSFAFLQKVVKHCDQLVVLRGSKFLKKFWSLAEKAPTDRILKSIVKFFKYKFLYNSEKSHLINEEGLKDCPQDIKSLIKYDDQYLISAYLGSGADVLVTTDKPLIDGLKRHCINCRARDEFLEDYCRQQGPSE